jgi:hypothetical protein
MVLKMLSVEPLWKEGFDCPDPRNISNRMVKMVFSRESKHRSPSRTIASFTGDQEKRLEMGIKPQIKK